MIICGVELTGSDAVVCLLNLDQGQFTIPECRVRKLSLKKNHAREDLLAFQAAFAKLMADYGINQVAIKERMPKGKFAGGAISFKLEAAIQLIPDANLKVPLKITLLSPALIKSTLSAYPLPIPFADTGLKIFQETAFIVAYAGHMAK